MLRCIYAYYMNVPQEQSPWMERPLHTLIKLNPRAYCTDEQRFKANIPAVSTFRSKGSTAKHHDTSESEAFLGGGTGCDERDAGGGEWRAVMASSLGDGVGGRSSPRAAAPPPIARGNREIEGRMDGRRRREKREKEARTGDPK